MVNYVTAEEILFIHARIIDLIGGTHGIRDIGRIASMAARPKQQMRGKDLYASLFDKAAVYFEVSAYHHPFVDGNKRTAIAVAIRFLFKNGYKLSVSDSETERFVLDAVSKKHDISTLSKWFRKKTRKI